jgi:hypothetical protein
MTEQLRTEILADIDAALALPYWTLGAGRIALLKAQRAFWAATDTATLQQVLDNLNNQE